MSPRTNSIPDPAPSIAQPGILSKSGLDITLENIDKHLASIDEKLASSPTMAHYEDLRNDLDAVKRDIKDFKEHHEGALKDLESKCASQKEFGLVQKIVFSAAGLILTAVFVALVALVVNSKVVP